MATVTEDFPVHVIIGKASEGRYLITAEMSDEQLKHLGWLVSQHPEHRGKYLSLAKSIKETIDKELGGE